MDTIGGFLLLAARKEERQIRRVLLDESVLIIVCTGFSRYVTVSSSAAILSIVQGERSGSTAAHFGNVGPIRPKLLHPAAIYSLKCREIPKQFT